MPLQSEFSPSPLQFAGIEIQRPSWESSFALVFDRVRREPVRVGWIYANCVNLLRRDSAYKQAIETFEFVYNDGAGVEIAARALRQPISDNLCGTDWIPEFLDRVEKQASGLTRVFLLGTKPEILDRAASRFSSRWPNLTLCGKMPGFFSAPGEALDAIRQSRPDVLVVGLGVPRQELFLTTYWSDLTGAGVRVALAGGAILDHFAEAVTRAPRWLRKLRMEWFFRLLTEPRRLWKRYLIGNTVFFKDLFWEWLKKN